MCGIMGYVCFNHTKPDKNKLADMFSLLETRGRDACGLSFIDKNNNNLVIHKSPIKSSDMIKTEEWKNLELPDIMILHTRMKTQGTEKNNMNNHPLFSKQGICIVHNGVIFNDKEIFGKKERDGEVDSEAILTLLSQKNRGDKIKRLFDKLEGAFAVAVINKSEPDKLILIKKDNPIELYYNSKDDILYFCSEKEIMQQALNIIHTKKRGFNIGEGSYHFYEMENNHALIINKEGVESYKKYFPRRRSSFFDRSFDYFDDEIIIECPWCFMQTRYDYSRLNNCCDDCGVEINEEDVYNVI